MRKLYDRTKSYFSLQRMISRCDKKSKQLRKNVARKKKELEALERRLNQLSRAISEDIENTEKLITENERALEALQSKLTIAEDVTIPTLVQSNKLLLERASADAVEQVRRQVAFQQPSRREDFS